MGNNFSIQRVQKPEIPSLPTWTPPPSPPVPQSSPKLWILDAAIKLGSILLTIYIAKRLLSSLPSTNETNDEGLTKVKEFLKRRRPNQKGSIRLTPWEMYIASTSLILPPPNATSFDDIGGLESIKLKIIEALLLPLRMANAAQSALIKPASGVLLYGPPGTGKTSLAKAIANEADYSFINVKMSDIGHKWHGDSEKSVEAIFSLARKLSPSIIFIDEVDGLFRQRHSEDFHLVRRVISLFMSEWDGLETDQKKNVVVIGATNRQTEIDEAALRRFGSVFYIPMPDVIARESILRIILKKEPLDPLFDHKAIAQATTNFSGAHLRNICEIAARARLRRLFQHPDQPTTISTQDLLDAIPLVSIRSTGTPETAGAPAGATRPPTISIVDYVQVYNVNMLQPQAQTQTSAQPQAQAQTPTQTQEPCDLTGTARATTNMGV
ncbi:ATPase family AAA domain-containing protein 1-like [Planoprotostelium fungivorum]|uniref:ATPase family AAA domain-containing protein 1-like n=1 Tax=Planoprotostelium fungivorum TaxID=1890364 RepID=A0A2P6NXI8_9EUKA|nr:ATPase family AAA domain-containing protein 1-like [Planoprotostelium fungivorum]